MDQVYVIRNDELKAAAKREIDNLPTDPIYQIVIQEYHRDRTGAQNRLMWHWLREISNGWDDTRGNRYGPESWKEYFCEKFLGKEVVDLPMGGHMIRNYGTSKLKVKEFGEFLSRLEAHAVVELEIHLTHTADYQMAINGQLEEANASEA